MNFKMWLQESEVPQVIPDGYRGVLYLMKGPPGSGKSFTALKLAGNDKSKVFSTDEYFERMEGGYIANWKMERLFAAHKWNQARVRDAMQRGIHPVVVDNTNIRIKESRPYIEMAIKYQYWPEIKESDSPWWTEISSLLQNKSMNSEKIKQWSKKLAHGFDHNGATIKNTHGVPEEVIHTN